MCKYYKHSQASSKSKQPRWLKEIKNFPLPCKHQRNAWMNSNILLIGMRMFLSQMLKNIKSKIWKTDKSAAGNRQCILTSFRMFTNRRWHIRCILPQAAVTTVVITEWNIYPGALQKNESQGCCLYSSGDMGDLKRHHMAESFSIRNKIRHSHQQSPYEAVCNNRLVSELTELMKEAWGFEECDN